MKGYKIFGPDFTCREYKFSDSEINVYNGPLEICKSGFHFCPNATDCLKYYKYTKEHTYAEVESEGDIQIQNDKVACLKLRIVKKLSYEEFGELLTYDVTTLTLRCQFVNGKLQGWYKTYYSDLNPCIECYYHKGQKHGAYTSWYQNGQVKCERFYHMDKLTRICKEYYKNGKLELECNYHIDELDGLYKVYYKSGNIETKCTYAMGKLHGTCTKYHKNGNIEYEYIYDMGKLIKSQTNASLC